MIYEIEEQIDRIVKRIPLFTFLIYSVGFIAYNSYITAMVGTSYDLISIQYLVTGVLCVIAFLPPVITLSFQYQNRSDNPEKIYLTFPLIFFRTFEAGYFTIIMLTIDQIDPSIFLAKKLIGTIVLMIITISFFIDMYMTSYAARNLKKSTISLWYLALIIIQAATVFSIGSTTIKFYSGMMIFISFILFAYLGTIADKKTDLRGLSLLPVLFIIGIYYFSINILPNISEKYGGFLYKPITMTIKKEYIDNLKYFGFQVNDNGVLEKQIIKLETSSCYILENNNVFVKIEKDKILFISR